MENLLGLLPLLACPLMMGVMMWMMMRGQPRQAPDTTSAVGTPARQLVAAATATETQRAVPGTPTARPLWNGFGLCLNWKVVAALGVVGLVIWVIAPGLIWAAVPILVLAACPLSMLLMMRGMQGTQCAPQSAPMSERTGAPSTREQRVADLQGRLASVRAEEDALAHEITALERGQTAIERQAEAAARGANGRGAS